MVPRDAESGLSFVDVTDIPLSQIVYVGIDPGINKPIASVIVAPDGHAGVGADVSFKCKFKDISAEDIETMREKQKRQQATVARRENAAEQARAANTCPDEAIATAKSTYRVLNKKFSAKPNKEQKDINVFTYRTVLFIQNHFLERHAAFDRAQTCGIESGTSLMRLLVKNYGYKFRFKLTTKQSRY